MHGTMLTESRDKKTEENDWCCRASDAGVAEAATKPDRVS